MVEPAIRISYWGSPGISAGLFQTLIKDSRFQIDFVVTQPDKARSDRGRAIIPTEVKKVALENNIPVFTPNSLKKEASALKKNWETYPTSFHVVFAYGKVIPESLFNGPPLGALNFHASLLPILRGASPIEYSLWQGFRETGWTLQKMSHELDTGDILGQTKIKINTDDSTPTLAEKLMKKLLVWGPDTLVSYAKGELTATPQDHNQSTYCGKISPNMGEIDWTKSAISLHNQARALQDRPGIYSYWGNQRVKIYMDLHQNVKIMETDQKTIHAKAGEIIQCSESHLTVNCGDNNLITIKQIQPEGKRRLAPIDFTNGYRVKAGDMFGKAL